MINPELHQSRLKILYYTIHQCYISTDHRSMVPRWSQITATQDTLFCVEHCSLLEVTHETEHLNLFLLTL